MSYCPTEHPSHEYRVFGDPAYLEQCSSEDSLQSLSQDNETRLQLFLSQPHQEQRHLRDDVSSESESDDLKHKVDSQISGNKDDDCAHAVKEEYLDEDDDEDEDEDDDEDEEDEEEDVDEDEDGEDNECLVDEKDPALYIEEGFTEKDYNLIWENIKAKRAVEMQRQHYQILQQQQQQQQRQQQTEKMVRKAVDVVEVTPIVSAERDCCDDVPAMELCPNNGGETGAQCGSVRRSRESISGNDSCCCKLLEELGVRRKKNYYAVEVAQRNISTEMFTGKIDPTRRVLNIRDMPARATLGSLLHPAVVQSCSNLWEIAVGYVVPTTSTMNRILLGRVAECDDGVGMQVDISVSGWLLPEQMSDLKWMSTTDLVVSYGRTVAVVNTATRASLASKRPSGTFTPYMSLTFDDESKNKSICETEIIPGESSVLVASQSSCFSRVSMGGKAPVVDSCHCFHKDGVTSARTVMGSCELASCTMESGYIHCFDARERWEPVLTMFPRGLEKDALLLSHDWVDENTCVGAYHGRNGSLLKYMDKRFTGEIDKKPIKVFPYDIRVRDGDCLISGEPSFTLVTKKGDTTTEFISPVPAPDENVLQPNVMCASLDDARFLTASNHLNLGVWSRLV